jgi:hypothetical protein
LIQSDKQTVLFFFFLSCFVLPIPNSNPYPNPNPNPTTTQKSSTLCKHVFFKRGFGTGLSFTILFLSYPIPYATQALSHNPALLCYFLPIYALLVSLILFSSFYVSSRLVPSIFFSSLFCFVIIFFSALFCCSALFFCGVVSFLWFYVFCFRIVLVMCFVLFVCLGCVIGLVFCFVYLILYHAFLLLSHGIQKNRHSQTHPFTIS